MTLLIKQREEEQQVVSDNRFRLLYFLESDAELHHIYGDQRSARMLHSEKKRRNQWRRQD
jgi:hypothetical protein